MENESLADIAPGGAGSAEHDEYKQHHANGKGGASIHRVNNERHHDTGDKPDLEQEGCD